MNILSRFLIRLGGDSPKALDRCSEKAALKRSAAGASLFVPSIIGALGSGYVVWWVSQNQILALCAGFVWGLIIFLMDRTLLASITKGHTSWSGILLRVSLAVVASTVFAHPLVLAVFEGSISQRIEQQRQGELSAIRAQTDQRTSQLTSTRLPELNRAQTQIKHIMAQEKSLTSAMGKTQSELQQWRDKLDLEINGKRGSGRTGDGKLAEQIRRDYIKPLTTRLNDQRASLIAVRSQLLSARADLKQLENAIAASPEVAQARADQAKAEAAVLAQNRGDFLTRYRQLHALMEEERSVALSYYTLCLLLVFAELTPMFAKLLGRRDEYDCELSASSFKGEQDLHSLQSAYPPVSATRTVERLQAELETERIRSSQELSFEHLRLPRLLALQVLAEKEAVFTIVEKELKRLEKNRDPRIVEVVTSLCEAILDRFEQSSIQILAPSTKLTQDQGDAEPPLPFTPDQTAEAS